MRLVTLIDNRQGDDASFLTEHGLSFYIETNHTKILLDVGASSGFLTNAQRLHIDIADVDILILSHAHADHTGGLAAFCSTTAKQKSTFHRTSARLDISPLAVAASATFPSTLTCFASTATAS
jgi:Metal-dependent hydrolases of the beta-lactamase superfamily II